MSIDGNKALVRRWFQAFNDRDWQAEEAARTADFLAHFPDRPEPPNGEGWQAFTGAFFAGFPDFRLEVEELLAEGDRVAVRWTFRGTHGGEFLGIAPAGKQVR